MTPEGLAICRYSWLNYDLDSSTMHPKFGPTEVQTHDFQIMNITFKISEILLS